MAAQPVQALHVKDLSRNRGFLFTCILYFRFRKFRERSIKAWRWIHAPSAKISLMFQPPRDAKIPPLKAACLQGGLCSLWIGNVMVLHHLFNLDTLFSFLLVALYVLGAKSFVSLKTLTWLNLSCACLLLLVFIQLTPKNDRSWDPPVARLARITSTHTHIKIENLRNFRWQGPRDFAPSWETKIYDLSQLVHLELIVVPFGLEALTAHTMLSFGFVNGDRLILSVEARKEVDEIYGLAAGTLRQFELIYLFGTETDLLQSRAVYRNNTIYAFPVKATPTFMRRLLLQLSDIANDLHTRPEFYSVLSRNCTTSLIEAINHTRGQPIAFAWEALFPAQAGALLHKLGYMDTELDYPAAVQAFRIDERIRAFQDQPRFSEVIRQH